MLLTPSRHRRIASVAPILALVICLPATALPAPPRHDPGDDSSFLCDLLGIFCGPDPGSDPDHTPPVPESGLARGHRSADPEKSFPALQAEPFAIWAGDADPGSLSAAEVRGLTRFMRLGGVLVVDDTSPTVGAFGRGARRELSRVLPESAPVRLEPNHVIFKTFYIVDRPVGRVLGPPEVFGIVRGKNTQVIFLQHDLLGALARSGEGFALEAEPGGQQQREHAVRLAVNIAMYVLCSDYKDDQVHAPFLMRRRARQKP